ncbi:helix-turn-helix domain-containing protein [Adlercreutzia equolifaciens]|uniref:helix-turn-helix domain-containing protein n=1 Tax=Adlercreutzia rubneri TaxID=2916441 RepID=UPI001D08177D|nr:helix-turn-helix domain-containing protein [Adlercreutzia rubneri]MCB6760196.1 helix-turn-helix domain-containing protein [Adlercreutzia equolifaciens]MCB6976086.1 helix-turn-helix domain-containing protein [Adlercreutzia equolifaciens]MDE8684069.1 helix-turn-helix domain-containing protein [Adlercreutzia rubneri]
MAIRSARDFGAAIRNRRKQLGYTQGELAEMCDVGIMLVSQLENGKPTAQLDKAIRVANMVGLDIALQERR